MQLTITIPNNLVPDLVLGIKRSRNNVDVEMANQVLIKRFIRELLEKQIRQRRADAARLAAEQTLESVENSIQVT